MNASTPIELNTLAVALGANLPSKFGDPSNTLQAIRPILEKTIKTWLDEYDVEMKKIEKREP